MEFLIPEPYSVTLWKRPRVGKNPAGQVVYGDPVPTPRMVRGFQPASEEEVRTAQLAGRRCIIVDDVLTTGATLSEAARALHSAGAVVAGAVVLAATRPPGSAGSGPASAEARGDGRDLEKNKPRKDE